VGNRVGEAGIRSRIQPRRLKDRLRERRELDRIIAAVRVGESRVLVVGGEPGVGKSVLLDYLAERALDCRVLRATGVQPEMELAFSGLHQLLAPMLERLERLPVPQRDALRTVFGMEGGPVPDRFLVGLAVLGLLSDAAGKRPLICLVDDEQWLDHASTQVLGFVARRLGADPVAEATDPRADPDRRAWHRAQAAAGPDETVAAELEHCAGRARDRGGLVAAAVFFERSALLTADPVRLAQRTLAAAHASLQAGAFGKTLELVAATETGPLDELASARADLLRGQIAFAAGLGSDAPPLLLKAAERLDPIDLDVARETYLDAWHAAMFAGHLAGAGDLEVVSRAARSLPAPGHPPRLTDLLLDGVALLVTDGPAAAAPMVREATRAFESADLPAGEALRWGWMVREANKVLLDFDGWAMTIRQVQLARDTSALEQLPFLLNEMALDAVYTGNLTTAADLIAEADVVSEATGSHIPPYAVMTLASYHGDEDEAASLTRAVLPQAAAEGQGSAVTWAYRADVVLRNGLGRHEEALAAALVGSEHAHVYLGVSLAPELIEAVVRTGNADAAAEALDYLSARARAGGTEDGLGIEARCRALLSEGTGAGEHYREAIDRLTRSRRRPDLARAHLLYGEWLRRERRYGEARQQLRTAHEMLDDIGVDEFAARARRELQAVGETAARHPAQAARQSTALTTQESQVARLAWEGLSNPEIAARLFISTRTVQYHLGKVFTKLGISSRTQLHRVLPGARETG
jgi:DNA-binding CsgD family transcriptional regulator